MQSFFLDVTYGSFTHISLTKASHMAKPKANEEVFHILQVSDASMGKK